MTEKEKLIIELTNAIATERKMHIRLTAVVQRPQTGAWRNLASIIIDNTDRLLKILKEERKGK